MFEEAHRLCCHRSAPLARIAMVKHLRDEATVGDFLDAWHRARKEQNIESPLSAAVCGFALLMMDLKTPEAERGYGLTEEQLYKGLERHFREQYFPPAALDCHAFDMRTILGQRDLPKDDHPWLYRVYRLLQESTGWRARDLDEQMAHLREFRKEYGLPGSKGF